MRFTKFAATINNPTSATKEHLKDTHEANFVRLVCVEEVGENGTPHLQIAGCTKKQVRLGALQKLLSPEQKAHVEKQKGTNKQQYDYCTKDIDKSPFSIDFGDWSVKERDRYFSESLRHIQMHGGDLNFTHEDCIFCRYV